MKKLLTLACVCMICFTGCTLVTENQVDINENNKSMETHDEAAQSNAAEETEDTETENDANSQDQSQNRIIDVRDRLAQLRNQLGYYQDIIHTEAIDQTIFEIGLPFTEEKLKNVKDEDIRKIIGELIENGYKITDEGEFFDVEIDFEKLMDASRGMEGPERDYIELSYYFDTFNERLSSKSPVNMDEYVSMLIRIEKHIESWPESLYGQSLNKLYKNQIMLYYLGGTNYQVFDYDSNKLLEDRLNIMKKHMQIYMESDFAQIGMKFLLSLESNDYAYHPEYIQLIDNFKKFGLDSNLKLIEKKDLDHSKSVFLPELAGHDNITIQESINQILRTEVQNIMRRTGYSEDSEGTFYFNTYIYTANSKYFSIECMGSHNLKDWTLDQSAASALTFDLASGEPLTLERLLGQDAGKLDDWMLAIVNGELEKYFGQDSELDTLQDVQYLLQEDAVLIIGKEQTHRAYIPRWVLKDYIDVDELFQ